MILALLGVIIVRRYTKHSELSEHHAVAGPFLSITATIFAVVLGFVVVDALNTFQRARLSVDQEANAIHNIFHEAAGLNEPARSEIRKACLNYADAMVQFEWPALEDGKGGAEGNSLSVRI